MEHIPQSKSNKQETIVGCVVIHNGITFRRVESGWINIAKPDYVIPVETPTGQILENLQSSQEEEKLWEVVYNGMKFERKKSGWINIAKPDYVIPVETPMGQSLERLYEGKK